MSFSCIIPLEPQDEWTEQSTKRFSPLKNIFDEVLIVGPDHPMKARLPTNFRRITSNKLTRAYLMNLGAREAKSEYLCFLHFDTDFDTESFAKLKLSLKPETLFYFDFKFLDPVPLLAKFNTWAANLRADIMHTPLGNQSYTMAKNTFLEVGAFSERVTSCEDAKFIKKWRQRGYQIKKAKGVMRASAEKYFKRGWLKTTAADFVWTLKFWMGKEPKELIPHG
jgi:hypothetical protein